MMENAERIDSTGSLYRISSAIETEPPAERPTDKRISKGRTVFLISSLNATVLVAAMNTGMLTVNLPHMGTDLHISRGLLLWYG